MHSQPPLALPTVTAEIAVKDGEKVAFLGDSITQAGARPNGYCSLVIKGLAASGVDATMIGAGISGHKSNQMLARLEKDVLNKKPNWMTLSCGVNDVWHGKRGVPLEPYKENITKIVDQAQAAGVEVVILTATMIGEDVQARRTTRSSPPYNEFLRTARQGEEVPPRGLEFGHAGHHRGRGRQEGWQAYSPPTACT